MVHIVWRNGIGGKTRKSKPKKESSARSKRIFPLCLRKSTHTTREAKPGIETEANHLVTNNPTTTVLRGFPPPQLDSPVGLQMLVTLLRFHEAVLATIVVIVMIPRDLRLLLVLV